MIRPGLVLLLAAILPSPVLAQARVAAPAAASAATHFTRDPALLRAKEVQIIAVMRQRSPQAAAEIERLFAQDLLALIAPELQRMNLDHEDMADMTAAYWVTAWEAANGIVGRKTDPAIVRGARDQIAGTFAGNAALARVSDRDKQEVADTMLLQAILIEARMDSAAKAGAATQRQMSDTSTPRRSSSPRPICAR